jgi:hypothetical protein
MNTVAAVSDTLNACWEEQFNAWMEKIDAALIALCSMGHADLPDWPYADAFEDERDDFDDIAREVLEDSGYGAFI